MYAEFADGAKLYFNGNDETDCICDIADAQKEHGECIFYTGVNDKDRVDGEYIGEENFIYY